MIKHMRMPQSVEPCPQDSLFILAFLKKRERKKPGEKLEYLHFICDLFSFIVNPFTFSRQL